MNYTYNLFEGPFIINDNNSSSTSSFLNCSSSFNQFNKYDISNIHPNNLAFRELVNRDKMQNLYINQKLPLDCINLKGTIFILEDLIDFIIYSGNNLEYIDYTPNPILNINNIEKVYIGNNVRILKKYNPGTFEGLSNLDFLFLNKVEIIGENCLSGCSTLPSLTIPTSVKKIMSGAFSGCNALSKVIFDPHSSLKFLGKNAFDYSFNKLNFYLDYLDSSLINLFPLIAGIMINHPPDPSTQYNLTILFSKIPTFKLYRSERDLSSGS